MVGTCYLRLDEAVPQAGRLLIFDFELKLLHTLQVTGSVQAVCWMSRCLVLGINNRVELYASDKTFAVLDSKTTGTFIHSVRPLGENALVVADMAGGGVSTFELKDVRGGRTKLVESAGTH